MNTFPTTQTNSVANIVLSSTELKNRLRSQNLFTLALIKFTFGSVLLFFISITMLFSIPMSMCLIILFIYETVEVINVVFNYKKKYQAQLKMKKLHFILEIIISIIDSIFFLSLFLIQKFNLQLYSYSNCILLISFLLKSYTVYEQRSTLESLKLLNTLSYILRIYFIICSLFVTLKFDKFIMWDWISVFWSIWVGLIALIGLTTGFLIITFSKSISYLFDRQSSSSYEILCFVWITLICIISTISLCFTTLGFLQYFEHFNNSQNSFITQSYLLMGGFTICLLFSLYFRQEICEYIFVTLQDDEPLNSQLYSENLQNDNQTLPQQNLISTRTQVPKVIQKISRTYFNIPQIKKKHIQNQDSQSGSPVLVKMQKGHKRAFSSQGIASQMCYEIENMPIEIEINNQTTKQNNNKYHEDRKKKYNSQLISINHEQIDNRQREQSLSQTSNVCIVCYERGPNAVFMECGHGGTCFQCASDIQKQKGECYLCRKKIDYILQMNLEERQGDLFKVISTTQMLQSINN